MYRIVEVSSDTNIGGAGKCLITLVREMDKSKFEVIAVIPKNSLLKPELDALGAKVIEVDGIADKSLDGVGVRILYKLFKQIKPDLVHTHASMSARIAAKLAGTKVVYTRHSVFEPSPKISKGIGKKINGIINNFFANEIIAVAEAAKDNLTATGVNEKKIKVILNGVDPLSTVNEDEEQTIRRRFGVTGDEKIVSIIARLEDIKGHDYFIDAASILKDRGIRAKFIIAGTGMYEQHLKDKVQSMNLSDDVLFCGFISDVDKLLAVTSVQANASFGTEATSLALLEGMSLGIPAVVSDFGGNPGVIKDGKNGFIVPKQNANALADGLEKLLVDDELYKEQSSISKEIFQTTFTAKAMTRNTESVYTKVIGGENNGR